MKNGKCPRCGSSNIHMRRQGIEYNREMTLGIAIRTNEGGGPIPLDNYVCTDCGYFENYIADPGKLKQIAQQWDQVK
jgi:predicted nucleic-acid-binding Zn-ribbon protein